MNNKTALRNKAKEIRKNIDIEKLSRNICEEIRQQDYYISAKNVLLFYPMKYEINLLELLDDDKNFFLPKVNNENLFICPFSKNDRLTISKFNVKEPCTSPVNPEILDLIVVPALMTDKFHYRLGYGGGFYDRFLAMYKNINTVAPVAKELTVDELPHEDFDVKVKYIITM